MAAISEVLQILQFGDSMFPVGGFSFSNGLESAISERVVHDEQTLLEFVLTATRVAATGDAIAVLHAHRGARQHDAGRVRQADQAVYARKLNEEMRTMTVRMGRKLGEAATRIAPSPMLSGWVEEISAGRTPGTYPAGLGVVFAELGLPEQDAFAVHQYGIAVMMVGAALRLMRLHYLAAQAVLYSVNATAAAGYPQAAVRTLADMSAFAPEADVLAAAHLRAHVRMFMN